MQENEFKRGWGVLLGAFIGLGVGLPSMVYYSTGIWTRPWQEEFGWTRAEIGFQQSISVIVLMLLAPAVGRLIDRYGIRPIAAISLLGYASFLLLFPFMDGSLAMLYAISFGYAIFGIGTSGVAFTRPVNAFFEKNRGLALGIALTSGGVMAYAIPRFLTPFVAENGWRAGYVVMFLIVLVSTPLVYFLLRDNPEDIQGADEGATDSEAEAGSTGSGMTFAATIRTVTFWKVAAIFLFISSAVLGLIPAFIPLLQDAGLSAAESGQLAAILGLSVMIGRLFIGFIIDRIFAPYVTATAFTLVALGCLSLGIGGVDYAIFAAIALGFAVGAEVDLIGYFTARYFGLLNYGAIYGLLYSIFIFGAAIAPLYTGYIWDVTGNYDLALMIAAALMVPVVVISLTLPRFENT